MVEAGQAGPLALLALPGFIATTDQSAPASRIGNLALRGSAPRTSPLASGRSVPTFHTRAWISARAASTPATARTVSRSLPGSIPVSIRSLVSMAIIPFRRLISGSLSFAFRVLT